jgi:hypothetical protein
VPGLHNRLREIAERASPRTAFLFVFAFVLLVVWLLIAALGVGD